MSDNAEAAKSSIERILSALGVARVVFVDDANDASVTVEDVIAVAYGLEAKPLWAAFPELGDSIPNDPSVLVTLIRRAWGKLDPAVQQERGLAVLAAGQESGGNAPNDATYISILGQLIPEAKLVSLSPSQWEERQDQLLRDSKEHHTLFLFDKDFSKVGGDEGGIKIIAKLLAMDDTEGLICGLLTHTVTPETQPQQWDELSRAHGIPRDRFVVIPKLHLSNAPMLFAKTLKFVALSPNFTELKRKTKEIISEAANAAAERVEQVSIDDFDHIVFQVPSDEGLWEPEMLFRLHAMFHRKESRRLAHDGGELETIAAKLRAMSGITTECDRLQTPSNAWALQREELYEFGAHINENHLPIELGDIFERVDVGSNKRYILLAQPCDLMVRSNGERQPELRRVPLVEVASAEKKPDYSEELPYFDPSPSTKWFVKCKAVHFVRACLLDLCVFNQDGVARLNVGSDAPSGIRPTWKARHGFLSHHWSKAIRKAAVLEPLDNDPKAVKETKRQIAKALHGLLFDDDLFTRAINDTAGVHSVTYNCKRVARLSRAQAMGLLMSYTATLGRPAYDRYFGKTSGRSI